MGQLWLLGCAIYIVGCTCNNLGMNVMKYGHNVRASVNAVRDPSEKLRSIVSFKEWKIGVTVLISGNVANFVAYGFAAQSMLASLGALEFVSNLVFASLLLKEPVHSRAVMGTCCIIGGCVILAFFGQRGSTDLSTTEIIHLYAEPAFLGYLFCMALLSGFCFTMYSFGTRGVEEEENEEEEEEGVQEGEGEGKIQRVMQYPKWLLPMQPVFYSIYSAGIGAHCVMLAKTLSELLRISTSGDTSPVSSWFSYVIFVVFFSTAMFWSSHLNKGLQLFPALIIVPLLQINWTLIAIVSGGILFKEFEAYAVLNLALFLVGVAIIIVGVFVMSTSNLTKEDTDLEKGDSTDIKPFPSDHRPKSSRSPARARDKKKPVGSEDAQGTEGGSGITARVRRASIGFTDMLTDMLVLPMGAANLDYMQMIKNERMEEMEDHRGAKMRRTSSSSTLLNSEQRASAEFGIEKSEGSVGGRKARRLSAPDMSALKSSAASMDGMLGSSLALSSWTRDSKDSINTGGGEIRSSSKPKLKAQESFLQKSTKDMFAKFQNAIQRVESELDAKAEAEGVVRRKKPAPLKPAQDFLRESTKNLFSTLRTSKFSPKPSFANELSPPKTRTWDNQEKDDMQAGSGGSDSKQSKSARSNLAQDTAWGSGGLGASLRETSTGGGSPSEISNLTPGSNAPRSPPPLVATPSDTIPSPLTSASLVLNKNLAGGGGSLEIEIESLASSHRSVSSRTPIILPEILPHERPPVPEL